jgi:hypothetical protein
MPSTYSPNLRIELIATGEQSGTWGSTTNTNLGTLIEDAISGYVSVSVTSSDQALTAINGVPDQSRNMVVNLTTTTGANFNVYIPPVEKFYVIRNSSAYNATIYCSTALGNTTPAGTGVTVIANSTTIIFSDVINVVTALNYLPTALGAVSGGTGQNTLTANNVLLGNGTSGVQFVAPGAANNVLISNGTTWTSAPVTVFPAGTALTFAQTAAPTGWTKSTTHNNKALRVVSGSASSGGSVPFTTAFVNQSITGTVGSTTLSTAQMPSHTHNVSLTFSGVTDQQRPIILYRDDGSTQATSSTGGGGSHDHTFTAPAIDLAVQYVDVIIATKD